MRDHQLEALLRDYCLKLGEHYEAVQIVATVTNSEGIPLLHAFGSGNYYARLGCTRAWLEDAEMTGDTGFSGNITGEEPEINPEDGEYS